MDQDLSTVTIVVGFGCIIVIIAAALGSLPIAVSVVNTPVNVVADTDPSLFVRIAVASARGLERTHQSSIGLDGTADVATAISSHIAIGAVGFYSLAIAVASVVSLK